MGAGIAVRTAAWRLPVIAAGAALALVATPLGAASNDVVERACEGRVDAGEPFVDVPAGMAHAPSIDCLWAYGIVQGRSSADGAVYGPDRPVTREQLASFLANALDRLPERRFSLPEASPDGPGFADAARIGLPHRDNVDRLHQVGILSGHQDGAFRPDSSLERAQMASVIVRTIEEVTGSELPRTTDFEDVTGVHQANVEKLASIGVARGRTADRFDPGGAVTRAQMASFLARSLDHLAEAGVLVPIAYQAGDAAGTLAVVEATAEERDGLDRVLFALDRADRDAAGRDADGSVGWQVRYVEEAIEHGSGRTVEVAGDAILEVVLTGVAQPLGLGEEVWGDERTRVGGAGIVEIVNRHVYEGAHQLFIGTTGLHPFVVDEAGGDDDGQRIWLEVTHPS